jgi:hypothetical protein
MASSLGQRGRDYPGLGHFPNGNLTNGKRTLPGTILPVAALSSAAGLVFERSLNDPATALGRDKCPTMKWLTWLH